ncbi:hypothetical protein ACUNWD_08915 [Sunxiuqinia sp. A32]
MELYKKNVYGIMGTLIFHILLFGSFLMAEVNQKGEVKEEPIIIDFSQIEETPEPEEQPEENKEEENSPSDLSRSDFQPRSNRAVNEANKDPFFDEEYQREIENAQKLVSDVNKQLSKEIPDMEEFSMPEETTDGMDPDSIKNTFYSGESNIHYFLENRYHTRLPIPVYLAQGGGTITVDIWVDQSGRVKKAAVRENPNIKDQMLPVYAEQAAKRTYFNADNNSPTLQKGTITYTFVPQ